MLAQIHDEEAVLAGMDELAEGSQTGAACDLKPDILLTDFKAQSPVVDSMRKGMIINSDIFCKKIKMHRLQSCILQSVKV